MHEYSILQSLVERVETERTQAERDNQGSSMVHTIHLRIGELSGVEIELLERAWTLFQELPRYNQTELRIETVPVVWVCPACGNYLQKGAILRCNECQVPARLESGDEIILQRIEMEVA